MTPRCQQPGCDRTPIGGWCLQHQPDRDQLRERSDALIDDAMRTLAYASPSEACMAQRAHERAVCGGASDKADRQIGERPGSLTT